PHHAVEILATGLDRDSSAATYERVGKAVQSLAPSYGFTIFDLPPFGANPEARYLARFADLAVLVIRRDHDLRDAVRTTADQLNANAVHIIGAVLTKGTFERTLFTRLRDLLGLAS